MLVISPYRHIKAFLFLYSTPLHCCTVFYLLFWWFPRGRQCYAVTTLQWVAVSTHVTLKYPSSAFWGEGGEGNGKNAPATKMSNLLRNFFNVKNISINYWELFISKAVKRSVYCIISQFLSSVCVICASAVLLCSSLCLIFLHRFT